MERWRRRQETDRRQRSEGRSKRDQTVQKKLKWKIQMRHAQKEGGGFLEFGLKSVVKVKKRAVIHVSVGSEPKYLYTVEG